MYLDTLICGAHDLVRSGELQLEFILLVPPFEEINRDPIKAAQFRRWSSRWECREERSGKYSLSEYYLLARHHAELLTSIDVFHSPHFTLPYFLQVPAVVTIHDVIHLQHPSFAKRIAARLLLSSALKRADEVITVSKTSREQIEHYFPNFDCNIEVVPNALPDGFTRKAPEEIDAFKAGRGLQSPYCLFVGTDKPHKGFEMLLEAWASLGQAPLLDEKHANGEKAAIELLVVGEQYSAESYAAAERLAAAGSRVTFTGPVTSEELCNLYNGAQITCVTSLAEGFGLCALEAMACGCPVLSTPLGSITEVCADAAKYSADLTAAGFAAAMRDLLEHPLEQAALSARGRQRALDFSPAATVRKTCAVYDRAIAARGGSAHSQLESLGPNVLQTAHERPGRL